MHFYSGPPMHFLSGVDKFQLTLRQRLQRLNIAERSRRYAHHHDYFDWIKNNFK